MVGLMSNEEYKLVVGWQRWKVFCRRTKSSRVEAWLSLIDSSMSEKFLPSVRTLMTDWGWGRMSVQRFLTDLEAEGLIKRGTGCGEKMLVISDVYQPVAHEEWDTAQTDLGQSNCQGLLGVESDSESSLGQNLGILDYSKPSNNLTKEPSILKTHAKNYRYVGEVIKLNQRDYEKLRSTYHSIADFESELATIDMALASEDKRKNWFVVLSNKLNYRHQNALVRKQERGGDVETKINNWKPF